MIINESSYNCSYFQKIFCLHYCYLGESGTKSASPVNIIEGKSAILGKMGDKSFMDIAYNFFNILSFC